MNVLLHVLMIRFIGTLLTGLASLPVPCFGVCVNVKHPCLLQSVMFSCVPATGKLIHTDKISRMVRQADRGARREDGRQTDRQSLTQ